MKKFFLWAIGVLWILLWSNFPVEAKNNWFYPLEIKAGLSSSFGEFRGNRLHTGVDLRTNMRTGYKVYAIDDGVIVRLSVKKRGFGNAVYIQHPNGLMSVYAHLDRFVEEGLGLRSLVRRYQRKRGAKYPGNIYLKQPVKKGQLIAYSGETGYGLPHLHFEVRRGGATPIDPFEHGFTYKDTTPPVIESFVIEPLGSGSFLDGEHFLREYKTDMQDGKFVVKHIPTIHGKVRFIASAYDQIGAHNKCAVDRIDLFIAYSGVDSIDFYVDKEKYFSNRFDQITYSTNHRGGLVYDYNFTRLSNPSQYYYRLYNLSPARFPYHQVFSKNNGVWDTAAAKEGLHTILLETRDAVGNLSVAQMQVYVEKTHIAKDEKHPYALPQGKDWYLELREFQGFLEVQCNVNIPLKAAPTLHVKPPNGASVTLPLVPKGANAFAAVYDLTPGQNGTVELTVTALPQTGEAIREVRQFPVHTIFATRGGTVRYGHKASMTFPAGALYEDIFANIWPTSAYEKTQGLPLTGDVYDFRPAGAPLEKKGSIRIQYPTDVKDPGTLGIFWWDAIKKRWYFMDDKVDNATHSLTASIIYPSVYAVLQDTVRPVISELQPKTGSTVVSSSLSKISAVIKDVGKGVDESSIVIKLDGKRVDGEYDPDRRKVSYPLPKKLRAGTHTLTIHASDKAGNAAKPRTSTFTVK